MNTVTSYTILNPASEEPVRTVAGAPAEETDAAIARAQAAWPAWRSVAPGDRARLLRAFAAEVDAHAEELAQLEVANSGHPVGAARWEAGQVRDVLQYYAAAPERLTGKQIPVAGGLDVTFAEPLGVVGLIVPWNFPMPILSWGMAPALAAGNVVVTVTPFEDEAVAIANDTPYGLSGSIWTSNIGRAIRVSRAVETGNLSVNSHSSVRYWTPFGGFKQSGLGRELGPDALDPFTEVKNVFIATD